MTATKKVQIWNSDVLPLVDSGCKIFSYQVWIVEIVGISTPDDWPGGLKDF